MATVTMPLERLNPHTLRSRSGPPPAPPTVGSVPAETTAVHTGMLRCALAADDSAAYWKRVDPSVPAEARASVAFQERWFGTKSEARVRGLLPGLMARFDAFPEALELFKELGSVPGVLRPWICHFHVQLTDPIYRRFTGRMLPARRAQGYTALDREEVARWLGDKEPGRWSAVTRLKFASNLLGSAREVGLVASRRDPRKLVTPSVPALALGYVLHLLRAVEFEGTLTDNPYLASAGVTPETFTTAASRVPGLEVAELGGSVSLHWRSASLFGWGREFLGGNR
jgi:hypothetical protein